MEDRDSIKVVSDQIGSPTWASDLAKAIWAFCDNFNSGNYHWSDAGTASWYDFACAIHHEALELGILSKPVEIIPIKTIEYPTPAQRPQYSVLDKQSMWDTIGYRSRHWCSSLRDMLNEYKENKNV